MRLRPIYLPRDGNSDQWEWLRVIRNDCAKGFTHNQTEITEEQQAEYRGTFSDNTRHYVYLDEDGSPVAFTRLEWKPDGFVYPSYGVASWARGKGYAWEVVMHAMLAAGGPLRGDLLNDNEAIKKVDFALGWKSRGLPPDENNVLLVEAAWPPEFLRGIL